MRDERALLQFVTWIGPFLLRWRRNAGLAEPVAEEAAIAVLTSVHTHLASGKSVPGLSFRSWLYVLARNQITSKRNAASGRPLGPELPATLSAAEVAEIVKRATWFMLSELSRTAATDVSYRAFSRMAIDGATSLRVAQELNISRWLVLQHRARWLKKVRDRVNQDYESLLT